ncbi:unnamed protein product [Protopolystoma xenopodis]|uniref:Uncharacterized protein n=1 Tax=Protopolystoma xenopodis TaxID=117903 RepID=A0A448XST7_9PLAT|nr:unnamed protein product [Protopolystoma xenopodis]
MKASPGPQPDQKSHDQNIHSSPHSNEGAIGYSSPKSNRMCLEIGYQRLTEIEHAASSRTDRRWHFACNFRLNRYQKLESIKERGC